jgi:hypothetical protein
MGLEDLFGLVLRQTALERTAAGEGIELAGAQRGHSGPVQPRTADVLRAVQKRLQQADGLQDF